MFDQKKYINNFVKENYKTIKLRIRKDDKVLLNKINKTDNINKYLISLIEKDIYDNREYHYINNEVKIDFELSLVMKNLVRDAEEADLLEDYGTYLNIADAIDSQGKKETTHHYMRESEWNKLTRRYCL